MYDIGRFNLKKPNDAKVKGQYQVKISNFFLALENLDDNKDISRALKIVTQNINTCPIVSHIVNLLYFIRW